MGLEGYESGGDVSNEVSWLQKKGWYHCYIVGIQDPALKRDNSPIHDALFKIDIEVLDGTEPSQKGRTQDIIFFRGSNHKDNGDFARKVVARFLLATAHATAEQLSTKGFKPDPNIAQLVGRQFIAHFEPRDDEGKYMGLAGADIYHVDDPAVAAYPKCQSSLAMIQPQYRWIGKEATASSGNGATRATTAAAAKPPTLVAPLADVAGAGAAATTVYDDI